MSSLLEGAAVFLLVNLMAGFARVWIGPGEADRMQAALLFGTSLVAMLLVLAYAAEAPALVHVALVVAMLAAWLSVAFAVGPERPRQPGGSRR